MDYVKTITTFLEYTAIKRAKQKLKEEFKDFNILSIDLLEQKDLSMDRDIVHQVRERFERLLIEERTILVNKICDNLIK